MFDKNRKVSNLVSNFLPRPILTNSCNYFYKFMYQLWQIHAMIVRIRLRKVNLSISPQISCSDKFLTNTCITTFTNTCNNFAKYMQLLLQIHVRKVNLSISPRISSPDRFLGIPFTWNQKLSRSLANYLNLSEVFKIIAFFWSCRYYSIFLKSPKIIPYFLKSCQNNLQREQSLTHNRRLSTDLVTTKKRPGRIS